MRMLAHLVIASATGLSLQACAPVIGYTPADPTSLRGPHATSEVEVYDRALPDWSFVLAGTFQEAGYDAAPGGPYGFLAFMRTLGAVKGCDAVVVDGSISRFEGEYETPRRRRWRDNSPRARPWPIFDLRGRSARCLVRAEAGSASPVGGPGDIFPTPTTFYSFGVEPRHAWP
jgi:hypothetical protein